MLQRAARELRLAFADAGLVARMLRSRHGRGLSRHRGLFRRLLREGALTITTERPGDPQTALVQTVIQLDGDVTSKIALEALENEPLLDAHRERVAETLAPLLGAPALVRTIGRASTALFVGSSALAGDALPGPRAAVVLAAVAAFTALRWLAHPVVVAWVRRWLVVG